MDSNFHDVVRFHERFGLGDKDYLNKPGPRQVSGEWVKFRVKFLDEELSEFKQALSEVDHARMFDALLDLVYVAMGTALGLGYPWQQGWDEVQTANMRKVRASPDGSDSKRGSAFDVVKPEGWQPPDIDKVLGRHGFPV